MEDKQGQTLSTLRRTVFLVSLPFYIISLLLPVYGKEIGASVVEIGLFYTAFSLMTVLLRPMVGWGLDRFGRRGFLIAGVGGYAATMLSFAFIQQVVGMVLARVFQGISSSLMWLSAQAITADVASEAERGSAFGSVSEASSRGSIVGTTLGLVLLNARISIRGQATHVGSWTLLFIVYGIITLAALVIALRRLPETRPADAAHEQRPIRWSRTWILLLLVTLVTGASVAMISPILIIFLQEKLGVGVETLSWAFLPSALVWALLPSRLGRLADRFGRKPLMLVGLGAAAASSFIIPALGTVIALALLWAFQEACYAAGDPAEQALVADLAGIRQRGRAYGFYVTCNDLGAAIGPLVGAWLYQTFGARVPFYANGVVLALCTLALLLFLRGPVERPSAGVAAS
ncbi:MAG: MFS transporter [Anaerolineae bacterium]|jgi:MFS family permease